MVVFLLSTTLVLAQSAVDNINAPDSIELGGPDQARSNPISDREADENVSIEHSFQIDYSGDIITEAINVELLPVSPFTADDIQATINVDRGELDQGDTATISFTIRVPESLDAVDSDGKPIAPHVADLQLDVLINGEDITKTIPVTIQAENHLIIDDVEIDIDGDREDVKDGEKIKDVRPGAEMEVEITIENTFSDRADVEIDDVEVLMESEGEADIDEDDDIGSIKADDKETVTFDVEVDEDADEENDDVLVTVTGEDENGARHGDTMDFTLEIEREPHELTITRLAARPDVVECSGVIELDVSIKNTGSKDEDEAYIRVEAESLGYSQRSNELDLDQDDRLSRMYTIPVPEALPNGPHSITVTTIYDEDEISETDSVSITKLDCARSNNNDNDGRGSSDGDIIVAPLPPQSSNDDLLVVQEYGFYESDAYLWLLLLAWIIVIAIVIALLIRNI